MHDRLPRGLLFLHAGVVGIAGLLLFADPLRVASTWPWELPPLAARFVGGSFAAIALAALVTSRSPAGAVAMSIIGVAQLLVPLCGWLMLGEVTSLPGLVVLTVVIGIIAAGYGRFLAAGARPSPGPEAGQPLERWLRTWLAVHLAFVAPVGLTMYLVPAQVAGLWPWTMPVIDVRLLGSIFLASALLSAWTIRPGCRRAEMDPVLTAYAVFATLALGASIVSFGLFDPHRVVTWLFFGLYVYVAVGGWIAIALRPRAMRAAMPRT